MCVSGAEPASEVGSGSDSAKESEEAGPGVADEAGSRLSRRGRAVAFAFGLGREAEAEVREDCVPSRPCRFGAVYTRSINSYG